MFLDEIRSQHRSCNSGSKIQANPTRLIKFNQMLLYIQVAVTIHFDCISLKKIDRYGVSKASSTY